MGWAGVGEDGRNAPAAGAGECQAAKVTDVRTGTAYTVSVCVWADYSTVGTVAPIGLKVLATGTGSALSASDTADLLAKVREDVRVPVGGWPSGCVPGAGPQWQRQGSSARMSGLRQ